MNPDDRSRLQHQIGRYRVVAALGQGGMGSIWLAVSSGLGEFRKLLVIKELRQDLTRNPRFVEMFLDEAKLAARLNHPNVVHTLEAGQDGDRYFLAMEFLDGQPLSELMQRAASNPRISLPVRLRILCDVLAGLQHAHELREYDGTELHIVHRDISPQNVFVSYDGQVKVVDFGIAKAADASNVTQPGVFKGKFAYAAPEQVRGQPVDRRADLFSVGVVLWEMVTLQRFAKGKATQASLDARLAGTEPRLAEASPETDPLLCEICDRALAVEASARFANADEFRVALEQYLLVSGERIDTGALAAMMQAAFGPERGEMHRVIDARLKESAFTESVVRRLRPATSDALGEDDPTKVVDLSELVESSRNAKLGELSNTGSESFARALRDTPRARLGAGIGVLLLFALIVYAIVREPRVPQTPTAVPAAASKPTTVAAAPTAQPVQPAPAVQPSIPSAEPQPSAPPAQVQAVVEAHASDQQERVPTVRNAPVRHANPTLATSSANRAPEHPIATRKEEAAAIPREASPQPNARARETSMAKSDEKAPALGDDLRQLQKTERRKLDLEDPFE